MSFYKKIESCDIDRKFNINIIYRVCDNVNASSSPRSFNCSKIDLIKKCLYTLKKNIDNVDKNKFNLNFYCVYDNCSREILDFIKNNFGVLEFISPNKTGNNFSFCQCINTATRFNDDEICYFLEDDYLFLQDQSLNKILCSMIFFYNKFGYECALFPDDYSDRYINHERISQIIQNPCGNFIRIHHTTCTFVVFAKTIKKYYSNFMNFINFPKINENQSVNVAWKEIKLFCPSKAFTIHAHNCIVWPEYVDIRSIISYIDNK